MIGLDTNILVRFLTEDDPIQSAQARRIIERKLTEHNPGFVSLATILETTWVLESVYQRSRQQVAEAIHRILQVETFVIQNEQEVYTAMIALQTGQGSFDDALIAALGQWAGCTSTLTFDKKASRLKGFELIS
jgi:predicted nucleic-acid-binding protein